MGDYLQEKESVLLQPEASNHSALVDATTSTVAMAMFFGSIIMATASLSARLWLTGTWGWRNGAADNGAQATDKSLPLDTTSLPSIYALLRHSTVFGLILFYSYICENHPPYFHEEKTYDRDEFFFYVILIVVFAGGHSWKKNELIKRKNKQSSGISGEGSARVNDEAQLQMINEDDEPHSRVAAAPATENEVLNRYQTEEWKGWMQLTFLLYHYMHAVEVYNGIRIMITCYVWMTGFGNFSFFYMTNDYSLPRFLQMLWRLNFLVFFLCLTHGNPYILYYICPLHTYFFLMVYITMAIKKERNYSKWWIRTKLGVLALIIYIVWDCDVGIFDRMHTLFLSDEPAVGAAMGTKWEWYFRSFLDHWSTLLGMVFALNFPITSLFYRKLEALDKRREWMGKSAVGIGMLVVFYLWASGPLMYSKIPYNSTNPYFGFIPLVAYIYLRNLTPKLRSYSMELLVEIGKTTLETYLMQHHIWLTSNSKTILVLVPGWPRINLALVTYFYVIMCRKLHSLTLQLRGMLLPDDRAACTNSLVGMAVAIAGFYCAAFLLEGMVISSLFTVGMVSTICGVLLYQTVVESSWRKYRNVVKKATQSADEDADSAISDYSGISDRHDESIYSKACPPLIGSLVLLCLGLTLRGFADAGAGAVGRLPPNCDAAANDGLWIPIDGCNESSRGMAYRDFGASSYGTCLPHGNNYVWAWKEQPSRSRCRFGHRGESKIKKSLNRREVVFIGDSETRYLYHASMRAMGIAESGAYDATGPKHADISNTLWGNTPINFKWAPLAIDQLGILKEINRQASEGAPGSRPPDLIVLGGGAWDRLHVYATDEDRQSHATTLKELGQEMVKAQEAYGAAVVWLIPTTINSKALNTEEKRDHMREDDMEAMRAVYARNGILSSSSFVIDGPSFTSSRVGESFDGVHYPIQVYGAGAQILFNALDWLLPPGIDDPVTPPRVGKMADPRLGFVMLVLVAIGLVCFDGFLGFSYLAALFGKGVAPQDLYEEAFAALHKKIRIPSYDAEDVPPVNSGGQQQPPSTRSSSARSGRPKNVDEEIAALLGHKETELTSTSQQE